LVDRVIRQRRDANLEAGPDADETEAEADQRTEAEADQRTEPDADQRRIAALEQRVEELEAQLEGLQDSVHREMTRQSQELRALAARTEPPEMARALGKYSRERGL
jgi:uncharacterized protein YlxW (UPF0749 family)